ncbi:uncharacterized protein LOC106710804 [Papilio machaon]|uniref:uncharacterized protein LOC106710804 n=1 Tax=Papilio machaon TaxID=76193 RepID=UPI001E6650B4|nr:uncharacterized protein LOC106710804 [Papilio machaon]XP_014358459.2 uncharacterized protein LOC106710804 [Papilio machaon]
MSRYKQPEKLEKLALRKLGDWIALQAEIQMVPAVGVAQENISNAQVVLANSINFIRSYLDFNVPWMLYDSLAEMTIKALSDLIEKTKNSYGFRISMGRFVTQMNVIVKMTEVLFTKNITYLSIDRIPKMIRSVFYAKLYMLKGLVYLNLGSLSGGWKTADMEGAIIQSLKELHSLKYLFMNYDCTDNILICIVQYCPKIETLDVSSSKCISNESIDIICNLKKLKSIQLYRTSVTWTGFANLLLHCDNLEDVGRCDEIGRVLEFIHKTGIGLKQLNLKTYVSRYATDTHLQLAVKMCPLIRSMTVFHNTLQSDLMILIGLDHLCDLKLLSCDFYADQIKQVLQAKGCNIISLHLEHVDQIDLNALMYISQMCPLLENFTLYNCSLIQHTSLYTKKLDILPFRNLKKLTCVSTCTDEQLLFLLSNCVNVEFLHIGTAIQFTDDFMFKILEINPLIHLRELRIMQSDFMTVTSVERIIHSCMSLEILVELESWTLLTDSDREFIRNYIKMNNFNIDTSPIRRYDA